MISKRKMHKIDLDECNELKEQINGLEVSRKDLDAMLKDLPYVMAALKSDKTIISLDETVRKLFAEASKNIDELKAITWIIVLCKT